MQFGFTVADFGVGQPAQRVVDPVHHHLLAVEHAARQFGSGIGGVQQFRLRMVPGDTPGHPGADRQEQQRQPDDREQHQPKRPRGGGAEGEGWAWPA